MKRARISLLAALAVAVGGCAQAPIIRAEKKGDVPGVQEALSEGPKKRALQEAACRAAAQGRTDILDVLLKGGAELDAPLPEMYYSLHRFSDWHACPCDDSESTTAWGLPKPSFGQTPLMCAAKKGQKDAVVWLLDHGAKINSHNQTEHTYCENADDRAVDKPMGYTALTFAAMEGHKDIVELLLSRGADPGITVPSWGQGCWDRRKTAADLAKQEGHQDIAELLARGVAPAPQDESDARSHHTKFGHHSDVADGLRIITFGAQLLSGAASTGLVHGQTGAAMGKTGDMITNATQPQAAGSASPAGTDWTQLATASGRGDMRSLRAMISAGADVRQKGDNEDTALHLAAMEGQDDAVSALIAAGADVNASDADGVTPLIAATLLGRSDAVRLLLGAKADLNAKDKKGDTALSAAQKTGHDAIAQLLIGAGATGDSPETP